MPGLLFLRKDWVLGICRSYSQDSQKNYTRNGCRRKSTVWIKTMKKERIIDLLIFLSFIFSILSILLPNLLYIYKVYQNKPICQFYYQTSLIPIKRLQSIHIKLFCLCLIPESFKLWPISLSSWGENDTFSFIRRE